MHPMFSRRVAASVIALSAVPLIIGAFSGTAAAQDTTTTITVPITTTTVAPTTTTTVPPTTSTTTTLPATTTTRVRPTTTTSSSTTTTTTPTKSTSSSKTWGWVLLAVVIALAALLVGLLIARSRRQGREVNWERSVGPAVTAAELARELILSQTNEDDAQHRATVAVQVDDAVDGLEREKYVTRVPDATDRRMATVQLTAEGIDMLDGMLPDYYRRIAALLGHLDDAEKKMLQSMLWKVNEGIPAVLAP